jgi:putative tricarboxylic transport membrane protein
MTSRLRADTVTALLALALAAYLAFEGKAMGLGHASDPGSGYIQFWTGLIMCGLAATQLVHSLLPGADKASLGSAFADIRWGKVLYVTALLVAYTAVLEFLGFIIATFLLLVVLFKTVEPQGWTVSIIGSALTTLVAWAVFVAWLGTQLPAGLLMES